MRDGDRRGHEPLEKPKVRVCAGGRAPTRTVLEIVHAMAGARADATENDPPGAAGWSAWRMGIRRSREVTVHDKRFPDWERNESGRVRLHRGPPRVGRSAFVSNAEDFTGINRGSLSRESFEEEMQPIASCCRTKVFSNLWNTPRMCGFPKRARAEQGTPGGMSASILKARN